jgi:hypothetical protein
MAPLSGQMRYSIHDKTLAAKQARIFINAVVDCAKAGIKPSFVINKMLWGISLYLECGRFTRENWRNYHRASDAAKEVRASGDTDWKRKVTFEHARPLNQMYRMFLDERATLTLERAAFIIGEYAASAIPRTPTMTPQMSHRLIQSILSPATLAEYLHSAASLAPRFRFPPRSRASTGTRNLPV